MQQELILPRPHNRNYKSTTEISQALVFCYERGRLAITLISMVIHEKSFHWLYNLTLYVAG